MATNITDDARRADILRRTLMGLDEDIEDLRAELMDALPDYEQRLRHLTSDLPDWLKLPPSRIRALFHFSSDSVESEGVIGPRTVALGAGRVEDFVDRWFDLDADDVPPTSEQAVAALTQDYEETRDYLQRLGLEAARVAGEASEMLERWLDGVLNQLDRRRESDIDAIEELVYEGEIVRGLGAREEIADLWEEQRRRAAELERHWEPLEELLDEGLESTRAGLGELGDMLERARQGLVGANPQLEESLSEVSEEPPAPTPNPEPDTQPSPSDADQHAGPDEEPEVDEADSDTMLDLAGDTASGMGAASALERPPGRDEEPLEPDEPELSEPSEPSEISEASEASEATAGPPPEAPDDIDEAGDTIPERDFVQGIIPLEEPTSEPELHALDSSSVSDYSEPSLDAESSTPTTVPPTGRRFKRGAAPVDEAPETTDEPDRKTAEIEAQDAPGESDEADAETDDAEPNEALVASAFRIRPGYKPVGTAEVFGVLLPPLLFALGLAGLSVAHLLDPAGAPNPMLEWSWVPAALAVALAWILLVPMGLRWRSRWSGVKPEVLRSTDVRDDADLIMGADRLHIDGEAWAWSSLRRVEVHRWESPLDETCGWVLEFTPADSEPVAVAAAEPNRDRWMKSMVELIEDVPYDAWQVDAPAFRALRSRLD